MKQADGDDDMREEYGFTKAEVGRYADRLKDGLVPRSLPAAAGEPLRRAVQDIQDASLP